MDRFRGAFSLIPLVFFWCLVFIGLMICGISGFFPFSIVMIPFGAFSLAGCIFVICYLKGQSPYWFLGLPLAIVLVGGILSALAYVLIYLQAKNPLDMVSAGIDVWGISFLLALAPCAFLMFIACSPIVEDRKFYGISLVLTGIIALLPLVLLGDMLCAALHITNTVYIVHPLWEGWMLLYGIAGSPCIGILFLLLTRHHCAECEIRPFTW